MEEALVAYLLAYAPLTALVSTRVYWKRLPQGATGSYLILTRVSGIRDTTFDGQSGLVESRVQFDCYGASYKDSKLVARAVEARIGGKKFTQSGVYFPGAFLAAERDDFEDVDTPDRLNMTSLDFIIWHRGV